MNILYFNTDPTIDWKAFCTEQPMSYIEQVISQHKDKFMNDLFVKILGREIKPEDHSDFNILTIEGRDDMGLAYKGQTLGMISMNWNDTYGITIKFDPI